MTTTAPRIDRRTAEDIERQARELIKLYTDAPQLPPATGVGAALTAVFARFTEIVVERLNHVPEKNLLAFLDLLGASPLAPQPARAPLTFTLSAGSPADTVVPAGTQAAAPPAEGEKQPVIFETERELVVTSARLSSIFARDPLQDRYAEHTTITSQGTEVGVPAFGGAGWNKGARVGVPHVPGATEDLIEQSDARWNEHVLYIAHEELFSHTAVEELRLDFGLTREAHEDPRKLRWEVWDGAKRDWLSPGEDTTADLTRSGHVIFKGLRAIPLETVKGTTSRWLRCRLTTPVTRSATPRKLMVRASELPSLKTVSMSVKLKRAGLPVESAATHASAVDLSKDFLPFGERPRFNDTLYLANSEAFVRGGANVTLKVVLTAGTSVLRMKGSSDLVLAWEYWNGSTWATLGRSAYQIADPNKPFLDKTALFAVDGEVKFKMPKDAAPTTVGGVRSGWIRVRIAAGNYGKDAYYQLNVPTNPAAGFVLIPATYDPPSIQTLTVDYDWESGERQPEHLVARNGFEDEELDLRTQPEPFRPVPEERPTLYLGFTLPPERRAFPNRTLSLFVGVGERRYGEKEVPLSPRHSSREGAAASVVRHKFFVTNPLTRTMFFYIFQWGTRWDTSLDPAVMLLPPGKTRMVEVAVTVPQNATQGSSDAGFVTLGAVEAPPGLTEEGMPSFDTARVMFEIAQATLSETVSFVTTCGAEEEARARLEWEYWNGEAWAGLLVRDDTSNFTLPGVVELLAPADIAPREEFGLVRYWVRVRWGGGQEEAAPRLRRLLLNTTTATQAVTVTNEILGSSDGSKNQLFRTTHKPVLRGERLEVREPEMPSAAEHEKLVAEEGADALTVVRDQAGRPREIWVRWHKVSDLYGSGPRDRHYVLDRLTGEVRFGDGASGMIPPVGPGNLRLARYRSGGGAHGNRAAGTVTQLKTTVPYVDKVTNVEPAAGGADAETFDSLTARAPRAIRHRDRAVTLEDYEDLAMLASPEVARARCVPLYDLEDDPEAAELRPGTVSLIVVPRSKHAQPLPSFELIRLVREFVEARRQPAGPLVVVGPEYVRVEVEATISLRSLEGAGEVEASVVGALARYLHPLTGGLEGSGWDFGRKPYKSDLYALLEGVAGVDHVVSLKVTETEDRPGASRTNRFLVYSGTHRVTLTFGET